MPRTRLVAVAALASVVLALAASRLAHAVPPRNDPADIAGRWSYRTRSSCGTVEGVGWVTFEWSPTIARYEEQGSVFWMDSRATITWEGLQRYVPTKRRLEGLRYNSLGDQVQGRWSIEGNRPNRLVVHWTQTNGCTGVGVATRTP